MAYWIGIAITFLFSLLIFRLVVRRDYLRSGKLGTAAAALEFVIFGLHANLPYLYLDQSWPTMPPLPAHPLQRWSGLIICGLGVLATLAIMSRLGFDTSIGQAPRGLYQTGPYRFSRNPQLLAYGLAMIGAGILYPSIQAAAWIILFAVISFLMVLTEEEHLERLFGEEYAEYCRKVPRFIIHWPKLTAAGSGD